MLKRREIRKAILASNSSLKVQSHLTGALTVESPTRFHATATMLVQWLLTLVPQAEILWSKDTPAPTVHFTVPETASHEVNGVQATQRHEDRLTALKAEAKALREQAEQAITASHDAQSALWQAVQEQEQAASEEEANRLAALVDLRLQEAEQAEQVMEDLKDATVQAEDKAEQVQEQVQEQAKSKGKGRSRSKAGK